MKDKELRKILVDLGIIEVKSKLERLEIGNIIVRTTYRLGKVFKEFKLKKKR